MIVQSISAEFSRYKALAEAAIRQLDDDQLSVSGSAGDNSIAVLCWHVSGNLRSRFTDFLTSDGEKPWRRRDEEFEQRRVTRTELLAKWESGWTALEEALSGLDDTQLDRTVTIRGTPMRVMEALHRALGHVSMHTGQIVYLAKALRREGWTSLSIPPGMSAEYNRNPGNERAEAHAAALAAPVAAARAFHSLHESGCFVMPNAWDVGTARVLAGLGFKAIATTSAGFAWSLGRPDNHVTLDEALAHCRLMAASVSVPVNADFEGGFAVEPDAVAVNVALAVRTGIAGLSIEDSTGNPEAPLFEIDLAVNRIRAARRAIDASGSGVVLTGRSEGFIVGRPDLDETIRRLSAYAEAGADCLFAPGVRSRDQIDAIVKAVAPKPVNVLAWSDFTTLEDLTADGVRRVSVGGALARTAWTGFLDAATEIAERGTFSAFAKAVPGADMNRRFAR